MKNYAITMMAAAALLVGCNQSIETASTKFNELPPAVQKTVRAQAPNAEIAAVDKTKDNGIDVFEVKFKMPDGSTPKLLVGMDGRLVSSDFPKTAGTVER